MAIQTQTVNHSRLTRGQALDALRSVRTQLTIHSGMCGQCISARAAKARRTASWSLWTTCEAYRELLRVKLSIEHRLHYLKQAAVKKAAAAYGLTPWAFQREKPDEYRDIALQFEIE